MYADESLEDGFVTFAEEEDLGDLFSEVGRSVGRSNNRKTKSNIVPLPAAPPSGFGGGRRVAKGIVRSRSKGDSSLRSTSGSSVSTGALSIQAVEDGGLVEAISDNGRRGGDFMEAFEKSLMDAQDEGCTSRIDYADKINLDNNRAVSFDNTYSMGDKSKKCRAKSEPQCRPAAFSSSDSDSDDSDSHSFLGARTAPPPKKRTKNDKGLLSLNRPWGAFDTKITKAYNNSSSSTSRARSVSRKTGKSESDEKSRTANKLKKALMKKRGGLRMGPKPAIAKQLREKQDFSSMSQTNGRREGNSTWSPPSKARKMGKSSYNEDVMSPDFNINETPAALVGGLSSPPTAKRGGVGGSGGGGVGGKIVRRQLRFANTTRKLTTNNTKNKNSAAAFGREISEMRRQQKKEEAEFEVARQKSGGLEGIADDYVDIRVESVHDKFWDVGVIVVGIAEESKGSGSGIEIAAGDVIRVYLQGEPARLSGKNTRVRIWKPVVVKMRREDFEYCGSDNVKFTILNTSLAAVM